MPQIAAPVETPTERINSIPVNSGHVKALIHTFQSKENSSINRTSSNHSLNSSISRSSYNYNTSSSKHSYLDNADTRSRVARESLLQEFDEETSSMAGFEVVDHNESPNPRATISPPNAPVRHNDRQSRFPQQRDRSQSSTTTYSESQESYSLSISAVSDGNSLRKHRSNASISSNVSEFVDVVVDSPTRNMASMADYHALELGIRLSLEQVRTIIRVEFFFVAFIRCTQYISIL